MTVYHYLKSSTPERRKREEQRNYQTIRKLTMSKMARVSPFLAIITVNVKGLNAPIERHSVVEWEKQMKIQTKNKSWGC